jgi:hypothetical protein
MRQIPQVQYLAQGASRGTMIRPGMLVRGRVIATQEGMVFEHAGGKMQLAGKATHETGWKTWRVESRDKQLVLRQVPDKIQAQATGQPTQVLEKELAGLIKMLFPKITLATQARIAKGLHQASLGQTMLAALHPEAIKLVKTIYQRMRGHDEGTDQGTILSDLARALQTEETEQTKADIAQEGLPSSLLVCHKIFPDNDDMPTILLRTKDQALDDTVWMFAGVSLSALGPVSISLRASQDRISGDVWCQREHLELVRDELRARCAWPVRVHECQERQDILEWPFAYILRATQGEFDARV